MMCTSLFKHRLILGAFAGILAANGVLAEVDDLEIYDLTGVVNGGSNTVLVCGTQHCSSDPGGLFGEDPVGPASDADLRTLDSSGYAIFSVVEYGPAGSGYIDPFLRFQHNEQTQNGSDTIETAYNTDNEFLQKLEDGYDGPPGPDEEYNYANLAKDTTAGGKKDPGDFNHAILFDDLAVDDDGYVTFLLDINEPNSDGKSTLRLDELSFFISTSPNLGIYDPQLEDPDLHPPNKDPYLYDGTAVYDGSSCDSTFDDAAIGTAGSLGCFRNADNQIVAGTQTYKVWDMDLDDIIGAVMTENVGSDGSAGSGDYDLSVRLSAALFDAYAEKLGGGELYVYLENTAGATDDFETSEYGGEVQAGFEEWAFISGNRPDGQVPVPSSLFLTGLGLLLLAGGRRLRS